MGRNGVMNRVIEGQSEVTYEDGGQGACIEIEDGSNELFVRLHSYHEMVRADEHIDVTRGRHHALNWLSGKRVRVTIEVIE